MRFDGRTVVVIGGSTGIGRATAHRLHAEGAHVVIADVNDEDGTETAAATGGEFVYCDVTKGEDIASLARALSASTDHVIYTAGVQVASHIWTLNTADLFRLFSVNATAPIWVAKHFSRSLLSRDKLASMTFVASVAGITSGGVGLSAYGASKGALIAFVRSAAIELAPVRVNCVSPGWTDTPFNGPVTDLMGGESIKHNTVVVNVPLGRQARPEEIAAAIVFVASDDASYMTGHNLVVDGGLSV